MVESFAKIAGPLQALMGMVTAASPAVAGVLGAEAGASAFNLLSGVALSVLGFRAAGPALRSGAHVLGSANVLVGVLGLLGIDRIGGLPMNAAIVGNAINVGIGIWGLMAGSRIATSRTTAAG